MYGSCRREVSYSISSILGGRNQTWGQIFLILQEQVYEISLRYIVPIYIIFSHPWSYSNLWKVGFSSVTFWNSLGPSRKALCFIISEFCGKYRHIPGIFHDYWWPLLSSRPSFGHLFQRCSSTPLVGENQAGAKKAASPSGGLKIFRGQMSGAMSARRSKSRGWGFLCPELPVAFPFWINHLSF